MKFKVNNRTGSPVEYENEIHSLCDFAQNRIGFEKPPSIFLNDDKANANSTLAKTGYYTPDTMEIHVFATGRHPKDILRSIAHELVHHGQHMRGELDMDGYSGKGYAQKNPKLRRAEMEANDPMLFRDWEDSLKEKENTIYNERRNRKMSIKDWKNNELSENLSKKWGFKMNLGKLNEGIGAHADDPMGGMQAQEMMPEPPMSNMEMAMEECMQGKISQGMSMDEAKFACMREMQNNQMAQPPAGERDPMIPFQEGKKDDKKSTDKHDDNPALKGGQKNLPDSLQQGIINSKGGEKKSEDKEEKEKLDEADIGGDKAYLEMLLAKYGPDAKIGDVAKKESEGKMQEANAMAGGNVHGHAGTRRQK